MSFRGRWAGDLAVLLVTVIWALNNVIMKAAVAGWHSPGAFNTFRLVVGALLINGVTLVSEGSLHIPRHMLLKVAAFGLFFNGANQLLFIYGLAYSTAGNAALWLATLPIVVAVISSAFGLERVTARIWVGGAISAGGLLLVLSARRGGLGQVGLGDLLLAGATLTWAGYAVFSQPLTRHMTPLRVASVAMAFAAAGMLVVNAPALAAQDFRAVPAVSWFGIAFAAIMSNSFAYVLYVWSIRRLGAARVALYNNLGPVLTGIGAWVMLGEVWLPWQWAGVALVISGVLVARWDDFRRAAAAAEG